MKRLERPALKLEVTVDLGFLYNKVGNRMAIRPRLKVKGDRHVYKPDKTRENFPC
jgi:hypothetical protein